MSLRMKKKKLGSFHSLSEPPKDIPDNQNITIIMHKGKSGLGLGIVGGSDTYLSGIVVSEIDPEGAAAKDGRLRVGDHILAVNGVALQEVPHKEAVSIMRVTSSPVNLTVVREDPEKIFTSHEEPTMFFTVSVKKSIRESFGMSILARRGGGGIFITKVEEGSVVDIEGTIQQGDRIMQINGEDISTYSQLKATQFLKRIYGEVVILVGRIPSLADSLLKETDKMEELEKLTINQLKENEINKWLASSQQIVEDHREKGDITRRRSQSDGCAKRHSVVNEYDDGEMTYMKHVTNNEPVTSKDSDKENNNLNAHLFYTGKCGKEDYV